MPKNVWQDLPKPIMCLAPMEDVTDAAFRRIIARYGKPDVMFTEFTSADGLVSTGQDRVARDLTFDESEHPIIAQLFTSQPEHMARAADMAQDMGFDGIDINMGCPDRAIEKQGCGSALMKNHKLAQELIRAAQSGAPTLPISVKTRIGYLKNELDTWLPALLETEPAAVTLHLRTRKEMSKVPARWEEAAHAVAIRNELKSRTLILGNGDVSSLDDARTRVKETNVDGVMVGRGIYGNPWFFDATRGEISKEEKLHVLIEHAELYEQLVSHKSFSIMKKHFKAYVHGWPGAKELRVELMEANNAAEVKNTITAYLARI